MGSVLISALILEGLISSCQARIIAAVLVNLRCSATRILNTLYGKVIPPLGTTSREGAQGTIGKKYKDLIII